MALPTMSMVTAVATAVKKPKRPPTMTLNPVPVPSTAEPAAAAADPVATNGCVLQPPPTTVKIGDVLAFNILDWRRAKEKDQKELTFRVGLDPKAMQWVMTEYGQLSSKKFRNSWAYANANINMSQARPKFDPVTRTLDLYGMSGGRGTYSQQYKGFQVPYDLPSTGASLPSGAYWLWRELIDGEEPIARVDPPFDDSGHEWALYVGWTDRLVQGVDVATGAPQAQPEVTIKLKRLDRGVLGTIEYGIGEALKVLKSALQFLCKGITTDKLQDVRNYGTLFPSPHVQGVVLAWQGVAQACGLVMPAQASGPPTCAVDPPFGPEPLSWWQLHQGWLIGGGIAVAGAAAIVYFLRGRPVV